ncbi:MAG: dTDP-glucose 4,6-dehydratase [Proteobacteria bacterium]|nr:dTDP-glucose 4,6-dehydratase [Pseudomonadota bacterium]
MKNILVTGGSGFIGSNFIRFLLSESSFNGRVVNVDKLTYAGNQENLTGLEEEFPGRYAFEKKDICDKENMRTIFEKYDFDAVCHFAAESHVDRSIVDPDAFIMTNIIGTYMLLEEVRRKKDTRPVHFHHVSTDEVYGSLGENGFFTETTPYRPNSPYSASKASSDHLVRAYGKTYGLSVTTSNCSNNYGPYQFPEKLIPLIIENALCENPLPVYGDGKNIRDWLYVTDHCRAVWMIMQHGKRGGMYNIGGQCEKENIEVVKTICDRLDDMRPLASGKSRQELITFVKDRPGHDRRYAIDFTKLKNELGWTPKESFDTGIEKTIKWYLDHKDWVERVKSGEYRSWIKQQYGD